MSPLGYILVAKEETSRNFRFSRDLQKILLPQWSDRGIDFDFRMLIALAKNLCRALINFTGEENV
jgi:hypothetical protein